MGSISQCSPQSISKAFLNGLVGVVVFKRGRGCLSVVCWLCGAVLEQHRVLVFGLKY